MNPFLQFIGPSLLVNVLIIALWKGYSLIKYVPFFRRFHRTVTLSISLLIVFLMTWIVSFLAMIIFTASILDPHSSLHLISSLVEHVVEYGSVIARGGWSRTDVLLFLLPIVFAVFATELQKISKRRCHPDKKTSLSTYFSHTVRVPRAS